MRHSAIINQPFAEVAMLTAYSAHLEETTTLLGLQAKDTQVLISQLREGLSTDVFMKLKDELELSSERLAKLLNIPSRTLTRRLKEGRFKTDESERILRVANITSKAKELFEGDAYYKDWLKSSAIALGGSSPLDYLDTELGAEEVENLIGRLEHGVFS